MLHDIRYYLLFIVLIVVGFSTSFHVLMRQDQDEHEARQGGGLWVRPSGRRLMAVPNWVGTWEAAIPEEPAHKAEPVHDFICRTSAPSGAASCSW